MVELVGPGLPDGVADPRLYDGLESVLSPLTLRGLFTTFVYSNATLTRDSLMSVGSTFGETKADTLVAIEAAVSDGSIAINAQGVLVPGRRTTKPHQLHRRARAHTSPIWDGSWVMVAFPDGLESSEVPDYVRELIRADRLGEFRPGVWLRPDNLGSMHRLPQAASESQAYFPCFAQIERPRYMAALLWDLDGFSARSARLTETADSFRHQTSGAPNAHAAQGWILMSALFGQIGIDPLMPPALLPAHWAGEKLLISSKAAARQLRGAFTEELAMRFPVGS